MEYNGKELQPFAILPISITNENYLQTGILYVCVCAHTKQREGDKKMSELQLLQLK